jgi:hypothetical protein
VWEWIYQNMVGNVLASAVWAAPAWVWAHRKVRHLHRRLDDLHARVTRDNE